MEIDFQFCAKTRHEGATNMMDFRKHTEKTRHSLRISFEPNRIVIDDFDRLALGRVTLMNRFHGNPHGRERFMVPQSVEGQIAVDNMIMALQRTPEGQCAPTRQIGQRTIDSFPPDGSGPGCRAQHSPLDANEHSQGSRL